MCQRHGDVAKRLTVAPERSGRRYFKGAYLAAFPASAGGSSSATSMVHQQSTPCFRTSDTMWAIDSLVSNGSSLRRQQATQRHKKPQPQ